MQRPVRYLLPALVVLSVGCAGTRNAPKYSWLRKQGPVQASERPSVPLPMAMVANDASMPPVREQDPEPLSASRSTDAPPVDTRISLNAPQSPVIADERIAAAAQDTSYYAPEKRRWNVKAIAALPVALTTVIFGIASQSIYLLLIGGAIAFALGLIGSRQCRDREDRGKGFAIAGMALGAAALFFSLMVLIWAA